MDARSRTLESDAGAEPAAPEPPVARLAANQLRRMRRIVDAAVELAEGGGFDAVRLRDVADRSGVALGTLYKYFRSKEDILLFAMNEEIGRLEETVLERPPAGRTPAARVAEFFRRATRALARRPHFSQALIRAMATGEPDTALKIAGVQLRMSRLITAALRGEALDLAAPLDRSSGDERERAIAATLTNVWFSTLVGWSAGVHPERMVTEHIRTAADLILAEPR
ncbi:MAG: TetR family transcriptional regulator [Myxococcota bacterium]|nr:TetR family transcriptional regulator [Myxococcota bacterium]